MKIIFLDIDGVVCTDNAYNLAVNEWYNEEITPTQLYEFVRSRIMNNLYVPDFNREFWPVDTTAVYYLHKIVRENPSVKFVISSSWREDFSTIKAISRVLKFKGLHIPIIGLTKLLNVDRGLEILDWLKNYHDEKITHWCAIDDMPNAIEEYITKELVVTDMQTGFNKEAYDKVCAILELEHHAG